MNKAFYSAYQRGYQAFESDGVATHCPYKDKRAGKHGQIVTFSRAFQKYWQQGFDDAKGKLLPRYKKKDGKIIQVRGEDSRVPSFFRPVISEARDLFRFR